MKNRLLAILFAMFCVNTSLDYIRANQINHSIETINTSLEKIGKGLDLATKRINDIKQNQDLSPIYDRLELLRERAGQTTDQVEQAQTDIKALATMGILQSKLITQFHRK